MKDFLARLLKTAFPDAVPELDLHGMKVPQALDAVEKALAEIEKAGGSGLRIICGKGKNSPGGAGVLGPAVTGWLDSHGHKGNYERNLDPDGRDGSVTVRIGKNRPDTCHS